MNQRLKILKILKMSLKNNITIEKIGNNEFNCNKFQ